MENRYYYDEFAEYIFDSQNDDYPANLIICEELNDPNNRIKELEQQLAEKDKEIKCIRELFEVYKKQSHQFLENELEIRKQVCDEIRKKSFRDCIGVKKDGSNFYHYVITPELLDQIEKGETK